MKIAVGNSRMDKRWKNKDISWEEFKNSVRTTKRTTETVSEFRKMSKAQQDSIKDIGGFVGGALREGKRRNGYVLCRSMLTLDMDYATPDIWEQIEALYDWTCCVYSTHKSTSEAPRLRLVVPLAREVSEDEYPALGRMVAKEVGIDLFDDTTYEPSRLMYWPSTPSDGEFVFHEKDGDLLDPEVYLSKYADWRDTSMWPTSKRQSEVLERKLKQQQDPLDKEGVVGAFCRAYSIEDAIEAFLSGVYEPSAMAGRYDYSPADISAGVVVYDGKFVYSHHATDPVCGKLLNSFDLVRLHKFGDLDEKASFKAMSDFSVKDERVKMQIAEERRAQAETDFTDENNWQSQLELEKSGAVKDTLTNISIILRFDPKLKPIVFNQFKNLIDVIGELPWPQVKPGWSDTDIACAKMYFERTYGIWSPTKFKDAMLGVVSVERLYHPVKDYLGSLEWDDTERLDTLLIDYLGADDTPYVRAVTRKTLVAAVARIYQPGVKFDSILVLNGAQGIGKSTLFARLGGRWYSDSLSISDMKDKTAPEKLQGYWILELGELAGIKKMDVETVKSFITRVDDKYRQSYGVTVESHPRSCIIVGTTNSDGGFLRDITGNRRFWPVRVMGCGKYHAWELADVDQIWAEAIMRYNDGEELFLKGTLAEEAVTQQRDAMEGDDREGLVAEYLDALLPEGWDGMDLYARRNFLNGGEFGGAMSKGTLQRKQVCIMEIWCECFCKNRETIKKGDSYEIEGILNKIGGWTKFTGNKTGKKNLALYGPQRVFVRSDKEV
ncbi:MAG: virulence-associated E family protein [Desulfitobacterium hafniense]|nr:virulence-associated E family protein [Desulfitobacterium hafniense]